MPELLRRFHRECGAKMVGDARQELEGEFIVVLATGGRAAGVKTV